MELSYLKTKLTPLYKLNAHCDGDVREGIIIKGQSDKGVGYFEYTPWSFFGDISVASFISSLTAKEAPLYQRVIENINLSIELQNNIDSLSKSFKNHQLISTSTPQSSITGKTVKIKYQNNLEELADLVIKLSNQDVSIRIDFNEKLSLIQFDSFITDIGSALSSIDYIEDPIPFDRKIYRALKDSIKSKVRLDQPFNHGILDQDFKVVYRPSINQIGYNNINSDDIFASHMGHPLGKLHCYMILSKYGNLDLHHGIETPAIYKEDLPIFKDVNGMLSLDTQEVKKLFSELKEMKWTQI